MQFYLLAHVIGVTVTIRSAKAAQEGESTSLYSENAEDKSNIAFDLTTELFRWSNIAKPSFDLPFLYYQNIKVITESDIKNVIHQTVTQLGMSTTHFDTQSLRVGGATTLSATLYPDSLTQSIGH